MILALNLKSYIKNQKSALGFFFLANCLLPFGFIQAQYFPPKNYPQNYFRNPLGIPMELSGNFGQLRPDHFHMGLDLRTQQKENLPVYAAAAGYVSRIKIERLGYGRVIYITHPNGYTTLYAHLNDFAEKLNSYVIAKQYKEEKWEQDIEFQPNQFPVSKGNFIGYSGNTGASRGAHLHFEIRDQNDNNQNPLLFGFPLSDKAPPEINNLYLYDRNYSTYHHTPQTIEIVGSKGFYSLKDSILLLASNKISFGISTRDIVGLLPFKLGLYQAELWIDSMVVFAFRINDFSYANSRYINACIDYEARFNGHNYMQHLSKLPGNHLDIFSSALGDGVIEVKDSLVHHAAIVIKDPAGNSSRISFQYCKKDSLPIIHSQQAGAIKISPNKSFEWEKEGIKLSFNKQAFYDTIPFKCDVSKSTLPQAVSEAYNVCCTDIPVHNYYNASIRLEEKIADSLRSKVLMQLTSNKYSYATKGIWNGDWMQASFERLGMLQLVVDTIAPIIQLVHTSPANNYSNEKNLMIEVIDNFTGVQKFNALLDGKWLMCSRKDDYYLYQLDGHCSLGEHQLVVTAEDEAGNSSTKIFFFTRELPNKKLNKKKHKALTKKRKKKE